MALRCMLTDICSWPIGLISWSAMHLPEHSNAALVSLLNMHQDNFHAIHCYIGRHKALTTPTSMMHKPSRYLPGPAQMYDTSCIQRASDRELQNCRRSGPTLRKLLEVGGVATNSPGGATASKFLPMPPILWRASSIPCAFNHQRSGQAILRGVEERGVSLERL